MVKRTGHSQPEMVEVVKAQTYTSHRKTGTHHSNITQVHGILTSEVSHKGRMCYVLRVQGLSKLPQRVAFTVEYQQRHTHPTSSSPSDAPPRQGSFSSSTMV